jgi:Na+/melibiose symporter-like transporter
VGEKLPIHNKILFGMGDFFGGGSFVLLDFFNMFFLTDVAYLGAAFAGAVVLTAQVSDAISDPLMGLIADKTHTRWGKRRGRIYTGFMTFIRKTSAGIALSLLVFALSLAGYVPDIPRPRRYSSRSA